MASEYEEDKPPRKRAKASKTDKGHVESTNNRRLFAPFRALGFITNHVPFAMQVRSYKGATGAPRIHILSCIGKAWIEFEGERMKVLFVGPEEDFQITSMTMEGNNIWVTAGPSVICYEAGRQISRFINPFHTILSSIIAFGSQILALTDDGRRLLTWDAQSGELLSTITFDEDFTATQVIHPATLLNKVLVSSAQGSMQLWNIRTNSGDDNSIKQWIFDGPDLPPRLLKYRSGHHSPPNLIRYYGEDGKQILTTGQDRSLRCTSVVRDSRSFELSQGIAQISQL
ncbi:hypothetical protein FS842_003228 [Serendipita sp. 407]|nr:hypothetical protein FS842_003228 [Serendipita sp. 407]